jgi:hypothetical protein
MTHNINPLTDTPRPAKPATSAQAASRGKTDLKYWQGRIFKPVYTRDGVRAQSANYAVEICLRGQRAKWSLETPNKEAAAARAKDLYLYIQAHGWDAARERYRPKAAPKAIEANITVGDYLDEARAVSPLSPVTFSGYTEAFRRIVSEIVGFSTGKAARSRSGHVALIVRINAVRLRSITPAAVELWKRAYLRHAKNDPISHAAPVSRSTVISGALNACSAGRFLKLLVLTFLIRSWTSSSRNGPR